MTSKAREILKNYWGYSNFRAPQEAIIERLMEGSHVVAVLPTGGGKSLCYQVPAMALPGICVVLSPLIALMKDQVEGLKKRGIPAIALTSIESQEELVQQFDNLKYGHYKFLYLSPERLQSTLVQEQLRSLSVSLIAVDEAHCISEWGHDFRPSYRKIALIREWHPKVPIIATTATATARVIDDIAKNLQLNKSIRFKASLHRPELSYSVKKVQNIRGELKELLAKHGAPAIVYTSSRKACQTISEYLNANGFTSSYYHGGLDYGERQQAYEHWLSEKTPYMVATNAFGMGIDKDNVRSIIHTQLPFSLENYQQESGRAGRDGSKAFAAVLFNDASVENFTSQTNASLIEIKELKLLYKKLSHYYQIARGELPLSPFNFELSAFCQRYVFSNTRSFHALRILEQEGVIQLSDTSRQKSTIKIASSQAQLFQLTANGGDQKILIDHLLRTYGGLFDRFVPIDEGLIAQRTGLSKDQVIKRLEQFASDQVLLYQPIRGHQSIVFLVPREDDTTINRIAQHIKQRNQVKIKKQQSVLTYVSNTTSCRTKLLLEYFDETLEYDCGHCDICVQKVEASPSYNLSIISNRILKELQASPLTSRELLLRLDLDKSLVIEQLELLLEKNKIKLTSQNKFQVN